MAGRDTVQEIKEKLSILDVVQPYVKLVRAGKNWKGLSPFTKEKTPSFFVSPERGTYYCFSSGQGGDIFTFIEKMEGVDFKGALKILAEKAGVEIRYERTGQDRSRTERLREALARAEHFFVSSLDPQGSAFAYAKKRGLTEETIESWRLGYAPDAWRTLLEHLQALGFSFAELGAVGLIKEAEGKTGTWYDRFRNRLMFPLRDTAGRTVGFTGRALSDDAQAKYLNSPETELFKKSEVIFGMDRAKDAIRTRGFALLVEGQMDVLHCHQAGFTNAIALSGTALTPQHLALIKRYADNLMLVLDSDRAGLAATARSAMLALRAGMRVKAVLLPEGKDPADILTTSPHDFTEGVSRAQTVIEFFLATLSTQEKDPHRLILVAEKTVLPLLAAIPSPLEREHFVSIVARTLALSESAVRESLAQKRDLEREVLLEESGEENTSSPPMQSPVLRSVRARRAEELAALAASYPTSALAQRIKSEYAQIVGSPLPEPSERTVFEVELARDKEPSDSEVSDLLRSFERAFLDEQYQEALQDLRRAEAAQDAKAEARATTRCDSLKKRIAALDAPPGTK